MNMLIGLLAFAKTPLGAGVVLGAVVVITRAIVRATKTKKDDEWLAKFGAPVFAAAELAEKAIPDSTQVVALTYLDSALKYIVDGGKVDVTDKKLMTVVKSQLIKVAKASVKVNTSAEEMLKLKK